MTLRSEEEDAAEVQDSEMEDTNIMDGEGPTELDFDVGIDGTVRNPESFLGGQGGARGGGALLGSACSPHEAG